MKCIILAGGSGDGLWPLSRRNYPKQFISNNQSLSVFQETITRNIPFADEFVILTNQKYETIVLGQMQQFQGIKYRVLLEEKGLGTAGAIALITQIFSGEEEVMIVPSDLVLGQDGYSDAVLRAKVCSGEGQIVLFGVAPDAPGTEYGYIQHKGERVTRFIEKPSVELADKLFWRDDILWNCGMLICRIDVLMSEMMKYCSQIMKQGEMYIKNASLTEEGNTLIHVDEKITKYSFDKSVLEQSDKIAVVRIHCTWTDLSDFRSFEKMYEVNNHNSIQKDCKETSIINQTEGQLVVANGLDHLLIVNTADALYISDKKETRTIKQIMDDNYLENRNFFDDSPLVYRPWGTRELIQSTSGYRVRKLVIYPGMKTSSHVYLNQNEDYTVVSGNLTIDLEEECIDLKECQSFHIDKGKQHRLRNNTDDIVVVIEVDTGKNLDLNELEETDSPALPANEMEESILPNIYKLLPAYKDYLWGGSALQRIYKKETPFEITAESWELSAHPDGTSLITGGPLNGMQFDYFIKTYGSQVCGWKSKTFDRFPILIKFIDAKDALSVQIHPDDDYAFVNENEFGKNEMWYVIDCKPGAYLYCGLKETVTKEEIRKRIENETLTEILNKVMVSPGDVIYVPAGTIHAIGAGILILEIQQNSNSTYRMYDYGRRDKNGNLRDLHMDKAMDVVNVHPYAVKTEGYGERIKYDRSVQQVLSRCKYFQVTKYQIPKNEIIQVDDSSFKSIVILKGNCKIRCAEEEYEATAGDSFFISAGHKRVHVEGKCELVLTNI